MKSGRAALAGAALFLTTQCPGRTMADTPPAGVAASGTIVTQFTVSGKTTSVSAKIAEYWSGSRSRFDVNSFNIPGVDATTSTTAHAIPIPGDLTVVVDGSARTFTLFSRTRQLYYVELLPTMAIISEMSATNSLSLMMGLIHLLHNVEQSTTTITTNHGMTNGHPTDDIDITVGRQMFGSQPEQDHVQLSMAEDFAGLPIRMAMAFTPSGSQWSIKENADFTSVVAQAQPDAVFRIPSGYQRAKSMNDVFMTMLTPQQN